MFIKTEQGTSGSSRDNPIDLTFERFTLFLKLSPELRLMIWAAAANIPETVFVAPVCSGNGVFKYSVHRKFPTLLHVNSEARTEGLKHFFLAFGSERRYSDEEATLPALLGNPILRPGAFDYTSYDTYVNWKSDLFMPVNHVIWPTGGFGNGGIASHWKKYYQPRRLALDVWFEDVVDIIDLLRSENSGHLDLIEEIVLYADEKRTEIERINAASICLVKEESLSKVRLSAGARLVKMKKRVEKAFEMSRCEPVVSIGEVTFLLEDGDEDEDEA